MRLFRTAALAAGLLARPAHRVGDVELIAAVPEAPVPEATELNFVHQLLERFRQVSADERYQKLSQLPEFAALQNSLLEAQSRNLEVPPTSEGHTEELPVPPQAQPNSLR